MYNEKTKAIHRYYLVTRVIIYIEEIRRNKIVAFNAIMNTLGKSHVSDYNYYANMSYKLSIIHSYSLFKHQKCN